MSAHTPGPWRVGDACHTIFGPPNGTPAPPIIATVAKQPEFRNNAWLLAAAPELLEALEQLTALMHTLTAAMQSNAASWIRGTDSFRRAEAAIKKARGKQ